MLKLHMEQKEHRLSVIMVANVCGFSRMMARDQEAALRTLSSIKENLTTLAGGKQGTLIKTMSDTFLLDFRTALDAVKCAVAIQKEAEEDVQLRIGIHLGDIYFYESDAFGEGINFASRLETLCSPGRVCISGEIYTQVAGKISEEIRSLGQVTIESISRNIETYEILTGADARRGTIDTPGRDRPETGEPIDFHELKDLIIDQIKYAGKKIRDEKTPGKMGASNFKPHIHGPNIPGGKPKAGGFNIDDDFDTDDEDSSDDNSLEPYQGYKHRVIRSAAMQKMGFVGHIIPYIAVNSFLVFLNVRFSPGFFWAAFPMLGWGIGILSHIATIITKNSARRDVEALPDLNKREYKLLRKIHSSKESMATHFASTLGVAALLITVNLITTPGFPWAIFPLAGISIGLIAHFARYLTESKVNRREFLERVFGDSKAAFFFGRRNSVEKPRMKQVYPAGSPDDPVFQAARLKEAIISQMKTMEKENAPLGEEMLPILENYVEQIRELSQKNRELDHIIATLPTKDLEKDKSILRKKLESSGTDLLKTEYEKSIAEIERQINSFGELKEQKEVINLRLSSAVTSLKQMQIDLARMKTLTTSKEKTSAKMLQEKSEELSSYLEDLKESYKELDEQGD